MNTWTFAAIMTGTLLGSQALATEWVPIKQEDHTVREIDTASINRSGPQVTFTARHTFAGLNEYKVGRRGARYLVMQLRATCGFRTLAQLGTEAYDEKMALISKQQIQAPQDLPVTRGSIDESVLNYVCSANTQRAQ